MIPDAELLHAWRHGDQAAGKKLFGRYVDPVSRFFFNKISGEPDDLVQETFARCVRGGDRVREFRPYLFGVAYHVLYEHIRGKQRPDQVRDLDGCSAHDLGPGPSTVFRQRREQKLLLEGLRRIPLAYQIVLELHYWESMTTEEIGQALGVPTGTIRGRLRAGRTKLKHAMATLDVPKVVLKSTLDDLEGWARGLREVLEVAS